MNIVVNNIAINVLQHSAINQKHLSNSQCLLIMLNTVYMARSVIHPVDLCTGFACSIGVYEQVMVFCTYKLFYGHL